MQSQVETATASNSTQASTRARRQGGRGWSYTLTSWLGLIPFLLFCLLFEILPAIIIIQGSFTNNDTGAPTLDNYKHMFSQASNLHAFQTSISLSLVTALLGGLIGGLCCLWCLYFAHRIVAQLSCWFLKYCRELCRCATCFCLCSYSRCHRLYHSPHSHFVPREHLRSWLQSLYILGAGDRVYVFPIATHDPAYTSSAKRSTP